MITMNCGKLLQVIAIMESNTMTLRSMTITTQPMILTIIQFMIMSCITMMLIMSMVATTTHITIGTTTMMSIHITDKNCSVMSTMNTIHFGI